MRLKTGLVALVLMCTLILNGCTPIERQAYRTAVAAKAFLDSVKKAHPECAAGPDVSTLCLTMFKATVMKDTIIDAAEVYCSGPAFESGGECEPPAKGTPARAQAEAKLKAAVANYNQFAEDLKGLL